MPSTQISEVTPWAGCYQHGWQPGELVPDAFAHPAKVAKKLAFRLVKHLLDQGYVQPGRTALDPFAGIGGFALPALHYGLRFCGVELEPRFVDLAQQNLALWQRRYGYTGGTVVQGDSRVLRSVLAGHGIAACVSSPPWVQSLATGTGGIDPAIMEQARREGRMRGHYASVEATRRDWEKKQQQVYGQTPGQLGALPPGTPPACVLSSPPYADSWHAVNGIDQTKLTGNRPGPHTQAQAEGYGTTPGQLGAMAVVGSPPYEGSPVAALCPAQGTAYRSTGQSPRARQALACEQYGTSQGQLGTTTGDTFWSAASTIMAEVAALLPAGSVTAWVVKGYIKAGTLVDFPAQWLALCAAHGFTLREEIHASLVETYGTQEGLFGEAETVEVARKSFFRRLAERKGSPPIDHETILLLTRDAP